MADTKVKISHILDSQIPDFIQDENPLFKEFLNQYYISQEHEYGNIDLAENITDVKNISNNLGFSEQHTRRILRHLFSEEIIIRKDQKNVNGRPNHLYRSKKI